MKKVYRIYSLICAVALFVILQLESFAYLDPSVVTYLVQAIAGVVIAGGAVFIVLWRKFRKKVSKTLNIDENKNKTVEEDVVIKEDTESSANDDTSSQTANNDLVKAKITRKCDSCGYVDVSFVYINPNNAGVEVNSNNICPKCQATLTITSEEDFVSKDKEDNEDK